MKQFTAPIVDNFPVARDTHVLRLAAPAATGFKPGQFLHLLTAEADQFDPLLRRPISILRGGGPHPPTPSPIGEGGNDGRDLAVAPSPRGRGRWGVRSSTATITLADLAATRPGPGEVDILYKPVGRGTEWLTRRRPGDTLEVLGPLGTGFPELKPGQRLLLVGGGVGIVPLVAAADLAVGRGHEVVLAFGARSAADVPPGELLHPDVEYQVTTEDGTLGTVGRVTALLPELLPWADLVFACGPNPMLQAVSEVVRDPRRTGRPKPTWLALEEHMGCAMGVCLGCVVETRHGYQRVCRDGPVFRATDLVW